MARSSKACVSLALWDRAMGVAIDIDSLLHRVT